MIVTAQLPTEDPVDLLLVDDRQRDLLTMSSILSGPQYHIVTANSGTDALKILLHQDFGVILLDVRMPRMDGFELAGLIKGRIKSRDTPIIFLTAEDSEVTQIYRGYSVGAVDYLTKPVDPDVVRAKVAIFAELFRKDRRLKRQAEALHEAERREREGTITRLQLEAERRYTNLAEAVPLIVWTASPEGDLKYANRYWVEYTGLELALSSGMGWLDALHEQDRTAAMQAWQSAIEGGAPFEIECRLRCSAQGTHRWHLARAVPERGDDGKIVSWLGTFTDVEESKQAIFARDEFLSIASHELRTPLTALKLRLQSLLHGQEIMGKSRRKLESAARQTERLERLIDNLLDVSRITTGHLELEPEEFELAEATRETCERFRESAVESGFAVEVDARPPLLGVWDRLRFEQVLNNLLSNALKYGNGQPVTVTARAQGENVEIAVSDRGVGIAEADLERIFGQFERATQRRTSGGLGMGLYIARQIVQAHGGWIYVESRIGSGSTFRVVLPKQGRLAEELATISTEAPSTRSGRGAKRNDDAPLP
jgi:PAS domain S-box-containing protein